MALAVAKRHVRGRSLWPAGVSHVPAYIAGSLSQATPEIGIGDPGSEYDWLLFGYADRLYDWGDYCGIPGGIPTRETIYTTLSAGATAAQINAALAACPSGQVVYLSAGAYDIGGTAITFTTLQQVTLRGAGAGQTTITGTAATLIVNTARTFYESYGIAIASGLSKGSMSITLSSTPPATFSVGNLMILTQDDDSGTGDGLVYHAYLTEADPGLPYMSGTRNYRFITRITGISGNTVSFATPIPHGFTYALNPKAYPMTSSGGAAVSHTTLCGVEDMTIDCNSGAAGASFNFTGADRCWMKKVESKGFRASRGANIYSQSSQCEFSRVYAHDCYNFPANTDGYGFFFDFGSTCCKREDCITYQVGVGEASNGTVTTARLYNLDIDSRRANLSYLGPSQMPNHGGFGAMSLYEGNISQKYQNDGYHGNTAYTTLFRNNWHGVRAGVSSVRLGVIDSLRGAYYESVVGNILGDSSWNPVYYVYPVGGSSISSIYSLGFSDSDSTSFTMNDPSSIHRFVGWTKPIAEPDADVAGTILRHGNFDYYNDAVVWDGGISARDIPASLFYDSKPAYFGSLEWPPIGPDVSGYVTNIPAKQRWENYQSSGVLADLFAEL